MPATVWTPEMDTMLRALLADGFSMGQTAAALNERFKTQFGKNSIAGRKHRLGMSLGLGDLRKQASERRAAAAKKKAEKIVRVAPRVTAKPAQDREAKPETKVKPVAAIARADAWIALPESRRVSLGELKAGVCRWPLWDGPVSGDYCGASCALTASYCLSHAALAAGSGTIGEQNAHKAALA